LLQAENLTLWRGANCLFEKLSFDVPPGTALLVRGPNGSGKTTLLRVLCGLTRPESGRVIWTGAAPDDRLPRARLAYSGHLAGLKADLTVGQNLAFAAELLGLDREAWRGTAETLGLGPYADLEVRYLSAGQKRRAALVRLLMSTAPAWVLDEPFTNLDADGRGLVEQALGRHLDGGGIAIVAAHHDLRIGDQRLRQLTLGAPR
jgi:heme exporter protein A